MNNETLNRINRIELLLMDVDGVLTDGSILYADSGREYKAFHVRDGIGIHMIQRNGVRAGVVSGRESGGLRQRCRELNIGEEWIFTGISNKTKLLYTLSEKTGIMAEQIAFIGDDLPDMGIMKRVGLSVAVADADYRIRDIADIVTRAPGGRGAVRELCELILNGRNLLEKGLEPFTDETE